MSSTEQAVAFIAMLAALDTTGTDTQHIDELTALEQLKSAISARQARITDAFATSHRAKLIEAGSTSADARRSVCAQIGLARRDSPSKGNRHVGLAHTLVHEMPLVLQVMERGEGSEWRATLIARETAHLSTEHHAEIDGAIADHLAGWSDQHTAQRARGWAHRLDPNGAADRARTAVADRRVTIRPAPDCMTYLTALLPVKEGVGVYGVLHRAAMTAHCNPDDHRSKGQVMADELVRRTMTPGDGEPEQAGIELHLVMTDRALADRDDEPAHLIGHGPLPAAIARDLLTADNQTRVWVRRLFTRPQNGDLLATDARRRDFPPAARMFLAARDQICRTPWCGAPIREASPKTWTAGPPTSATPAPSPPPPRPATPTAATHPRRRNPRPGHHARIPGSNEPPACRSCRSRSTGPPRISLSGNDNLMWLNGAIAVASSDIGDTPGLQYCPADPRRTPGYLRRNIKLGPVMLVAELREFGIELEPSAGSGIAASKEVSSPCISSRGDRS